MTIDRLSRMHSAEHLLNGTMVQIYGCGRSFSAHINKKKSKCDYQFDRDLTAEEIAELELRINRVILDDLPVSEVMLERRVAADKFDLERLPEEVGNEIRVIQIGDYDSVPCIGEHVNHTRQIGSFRIVSSDFNSGVLRIRFKLTESVQ